MNADILKKHIDTLLELRKVFCSDCEMRKARVSCCVGDFEDSRPCEYIVSLQFAIAILIVLKSEAEKCR